MFDDCLLLYVVHHASPVSRGWWPVRAPQRALPQVRAQMMIQHPRYVFWEYLGCRVKGMADMTVVGLRVVREVAATGSFSEAAALSATRSRLYPGR